MTEGADRRCRFGDMFLAELSEGDRSFEQLLAFASSVGSDGAELTSWLAMARDSRVVMADTRRVGPTTFRLDARGQKILSQDRRMPAAA